MSINQRRFIRLEFPPEERMEVILESGDCKPRRCVLANLSVGGLAVDMEEEIAPLEVGQEVVLKLPLRSREEMDSIRGIVIFFNRFQSYRAGVKFIFAPDEPSNDHKQDLIKTFLINEISKRSSVWRRQDDAALVLCGSGRR